MENIYRAANSCITTSTTLYQKTAHIFFLHHNLTYNFIFLIHTFLYPVIIIQYATTDDPDSTIERDTYKEYHSIATCIIVLYGLP